MSFPAGILLVLIGCCLMWVAMRGVETATPAGIYESLMDGMSGTVSRTESGTGVPEERNAIDDEGLPEGML